MTTTLRFSIGSTVAPGDRLGSVRQVAAGIGTYSRGGHVYSSVVGKLGIQNDHQAAGTKDAPSSASDLPIVSVKIPPGRQIASSKVLQVGQVVLGRVSRILMQQAVVEIVAAEGVGALPHSHQGAIRKEDVRSRASEEIKMVDAFRPGDTVLCRILSLGDSRRYYLSTAEAELGVVRAKSASSGSVMRPISWKEMECPETGIKETRKCAKPTNLAQLLSMAV